MSEELPKFLEVLCHGCQAPMKFQALPATYVDWDGVPRTYWGKDTAVWICRTCRQDPKKLEAARLATGWLPKKAGVSEYDDTETDRNT